MLGYGDGIIFDSTDGELLGDILGAADSITLGVCKGTEPGYLDGSFNSYNDGIRVG